MSVIVGYFIENLVISFLTVLICQSIGILLMMTLKVKLSDSYQSLLIITFSGFLTLSTLFAIWKTGGKTIMIGYCMIMLFLYYDFVSYSKNKTTNTSAIHEGFFSFRSLPPYLGQVFFVIALIICYRLAFLNSDGFLNEPVYKDYVYYAKLSEYLLQTGIENPNLDYVFGNGAISPYHYTDVWINSLIRLLTGRNAVILMILSSYSIGTVLVWMSFMAIWEQYYPTKHTGVLLSIVLLFFGGLYLGYLSERSFWVSTGTFSMHVLNYAKLFPLYVASALMIIAIHRKRQYLASILLIFPLINISTLPGVSVLILTIVIYKIVKEKTLDIATVLKAITLISFIGVLYIAYGNSHGSEATNIKIDIDYLRTVANVLGGSFIQISLMYFPIIVVLVVYRKYLKLPQEVSLMPIIVFACFALPWAFLHKMPNSVQFFSNFYIPFMACFSVNLFLFLIKQSNGVHRNIVVALFLLLPIVSLGRDVSQRVKVSQSSSFKIGEIAEIANFFESVKNPLGVYFLDKYTWASMNPVFGAPDMRFQQFVNRPGFHSVSLSILQLPLDSSSTHFDTERQYILRSIFANYVNKKFGKPYELDTTDTSTIHKAQLSFIDDHNINFAISNYEYLFPPSQRDRFILRFENKHLNYRIYEVRSSIIE